MREEKFAVRVVCEDDINEWLRFRKMLWDELSDEEHRTEMVDIYQHTETQLVLVADVGGGKLCGFLEASIRPFVEDCHSERVGYLEGWFVDEKYRENGIGGKLVREAERWARRRGATEMASDAEVGNEMSLKVHQSLGYEETSRLVHLRKDLI